MPLLTKWQPLLGVFEVSVKRILIKLWTTSGFILKQLNYSFSISMGDSWLRLRLSNVTQVKANSGYSCGNLLEPCAKFRGLKWGINFSYRSETGYGKSQILALNRCKFQGLGCTSPPKTLGSSPTSPIPPGSETTAYFWKNVHRLFHWLPLWKGKRITENDFSNEDIIKDKMVHHS